MKDKYTQKSADNKKETIKNIPALINRTFPVPARFRAALPSDIAGLSRLLTNNRGDRSLSYLSRPNYLFAYLHYFLPWNLYRLCHLLPTLELTLSAGDTITDLGSGPLTFASALWIAVPALRKIPLEINCIDRSGQALEAGKKLFSSLCESTGGGASWKINPIKEDIDLRKTNLDLSGPKRKRAALVCAVNVFNEIYENLSHNNTEGLRRLAANSAKLMNALACAGASILTVEPGVPQSGRFISFLREAFLEHNWLPSSPCTHTGACPCLAGKKRWCHFSIIPADAPKELHSLSAAAKLPKQRLVYGYLLTKKTSAKKNNAGTRIISDAFALPQNRFGRYGCSSYGLVLLSGTREQIERIPSGSLFIPAFAEFETDFPEKGQRDRKSGALIIDLQAKEAL